MIKDEQVRRLWLLASKREPIYRSALRAGMSEKTARKYCRERKLPSVMKGNHDWKTRKDPFEDDWAEIVGLLSIDERIESLTIFEWLKREREGRYHDGQLRTLQRKVKRWRAQYGADKEIFFPQEHHPGRLCESDFTEMSSLGITICKELFNHLIYHFVLTYSNWETGTVCFSESAESLRCGFQNAVWELGGVPERHQTDRLSTAVNKEASKEEFTESVAVS